MTDPSQTNAWIIDMNQLMATTQSTDSEPLKFYLHPGQLFACTKNYAVTTILGSCVSVCLWDPSTKIGGINHFLLPYDVGDGQAPARFGNLAVRDLIDQVLALGAAQSRLQAKLFGGACVLDAFRGRATHLGMKNVEVARDLLEKANIPILGEAVGGDRGRKLIFYTDSGSAWVKAL